MGGGTPTALPHDELSILLRGLRDSLDLSAEIEWTVEATPATLTASTAKLLADHSVNRLSMGVQSFNCHALDSIQRRSKTASPASAVAYARDAGITNIGLDLIAALPGVTTGQWQQTLLDALALEPTHLSVYSLTVEPASTMSAQIAKGSIHAPGDDQQISALDMARDSLRAHGYQRYEISNYARPGFECRHNNDIWYGSDYLGLGPASSSRLGLTRRTNAPDLLSWRHALEQNALPPASAETLRRADDVTERRAFQLRCINGISEQLNPDWSTVLQSLSKHGLTRLHNNRWQLTDTGVHVADAIIAELL